MPSLLILLPLAVLVIFNLPLGMAMRRLYYWIVATVLVAQGFFVAVTPFFDWKALNDPLAMFFEYKLSIDAFSLIMLFIIALVASVSLQVARYTIEPGRKTEGFINLLLVTVIGMNAIVMANGIFSLYVFVEVVAVSSFILIAMNKSKFAMEGAFKYLILSAVASVMILFAIAILFFISGDTSFSSVQSAAKVQAASAYVKIAMMLLIAGLFIKSGIVPFHGWLPDAYTESQAPVSVLLAGIVTKTVGVYALIRLMYYVFGMSPAAQKILMFAGALSIVVGALAAITQKNFKKMLAYSSVSQMGYIILALGCGTTMAIIGAVFHLLNHAIFKSLLFVNSASVEKSLGTVDMEKMGGLGQKMPVTGFTSVIAFLSTAGIPPLSGFWSKLIIITALWTAGNTGYAALALVSSIITLGYFLSMQSMAFFGQVRNGLEDVKESGMGLAIPQAILAIVTIGIGLLFPVIYNLFLMPLGNILR